ncbi:ras-specific guanine nucleotide-releasing factor RalGPS1 [Wyeomyia smithii]|uniref:ras-specific guanine nucleotide-releasing factor RalGPS1 n=1 Tax=Wyeomyia smithii TaxID=174621 RepID=UPI0024680654|nr:ras-specific guanine nucleotide-releasing factor RalGPS1 [Wyeomyia smithii]XP_055541463.1 ras-specific guanine nucleotide-releasing factor RalGPS1 [Wyeomyia smithii]XP_055541464.1 ras-specific guanine nucleotide-releasing factor RalGPS1 [Wyeomyia smithii]
MMRYSEITGDVSSNTMRFQEFSHENLYFENLRDESPQSDVSTQSGSAFPLIGTLEKEGAVTTQHTKYQYHKKHSVDSINPIESIIDRSRATTYKRCSTPNKSQSLPPNSSIANIDSIIISCLGVAPEELANQLTLLDFPVFTAIQPDELTSCAWNKKNKAELSPNVVAFTKRFNHTIFWTVQEVLNGISAKERAEIITHFIKVAKYLHELNNLHSLFAITSALKSASVYRLDKSWSHVSRRDKQLFEKLAEIFHDANNWALLRVYLESLKLPCIPYLGLFLTDLVYIDLAHPHKSGLEPEQRRAKMNNILRVISNYQGSDYSNIQPIANILNYLNSVRYIEELQNIFEDDQYKKSLYLEPLNSLSTLPMEVSNKKNGCAKPTSPVNTDIGQITPSSLAFLNLSPAKSSSMRFSNSSTNTASNRFIGHRKCRSLGTNIFNKISCTNVQNAENSTQPSESFVKSRHLLDDSVIENKVSTDATSTGSSEGVIGFENDGELLGFQGCLRRKTLMKHRRKSTVSSWKRYWVQIWANSLVYFSPKTFKGTERSDYKREPAKICNLEGWHVEMKDTAQCDAFHLVNQQFGHIYKFRTGSTALNALWVKALNAVISQFTIKIVDKPPVNLMSFE